MSASVIRRRVVVHGMVQGVFFRDACRREAIRHDVKGWVRNRADGTVEAVFEGRSDDVQSMIEWARRGPPAAYVQRVDTTEESVEDLAGFRVRHG